MDQPTGAIAPAELQSPKHNGTTTAAQAMPSSDPHSPDVITETNSSSSPATAHPAKARKFHKLIKMLNHAIHPLFAKDKGKDKAVGKEKEKESTTAKGAPMVQGDAQEEARTTKKGGEFALGRIIKKAMNPKK